MVGDNLLPSYSAQVNNQQQVSYLTSDHLGSPRLITDATGKVIARHDYSAFSDETFTVQRTQSLNYKPDTIRQDYTGYQKDDESGLEFAQARYYNTSHGRFTSIDPLTASANVKDPQTFNRYSYAMNSPYKFTDPLGLISSSTGACGTWCLNSDGGGGGYSSNYDSGQRAGRQTTDTPRNRILAILAKIRKEQENTIIKSDPGQVQTAVIESRQPEELSESCKNPKFVVPYVSVPDYTSRMPYQMQNTNPNYPNYPVDAEGQGVTPTLVLHYINDDITVVNLPFEVEEEGKSGVISSSDGMANLSPFIIDERKIPDRGDGMEPYTMRGRNGEETLIPGGPVLVGIPTKNEPRIRNLRVTVQFPQCGKIVPYTYQIQLKVWVNKNGTPRSAISY
jgi:RHS repeat-associated protein